MGKKKTNKQKIDVILPTHGISTPSKKQDFTEF